MPAAPLLPVAIALAATLAGPGPGATLAESVAPGATLAAVMPAATMMAEPAPGALAAAVAVALEASVGQAVTVTVTVTNTGGQPVADPRPVLHPGGAAGTFRRAPPLGGALAPGEARTVAWTFEPAAPGIVVLSVSVTGTNTAGPEPEASARAILLVVRPAALATEAALSATAAVPGQWVSLTVTVTNPGGAAATGVTIPMPAPSTARLTPARGPVRAVVDRLEPGSATVFIWSWSVSGAGMASFFVRPSGRDANSGRTVVAQGVESGRVRLLRPAALRLESLYLLPNPVARPGEFIEATLVVTNSGEAPAEVTGVDIREKKSQGDAVGQPTIRSPVFPAEMPGGDSRSIVWAYRAGPGGTAQASAAVEARELETGRGFKLPAVLSNIVVISATAIR